MALTLTPSRKTLLFNVLVILAIVIGLILIYLQVSNLRRLNEEVEIEEAALNQARIILNRRLEHKANAPEYQAKYNLLSIKIPNKPEEEEILRYMAFLAEEYNLSVNDIRFGSRAVHQEEGYIRMPLVITAEGRYRDLVGLLGHFYQDGRAIRVDNIAITVSSIETVKLRIILTANAFHSISE